MNSAELIQELQRRTVNTPYTITVTEKGFELSLNIADAKYYIPMYKVGVKRAFKIVAKVNELKKTVQTTDVLAKLDWQAGAGVDNATPHIDWNASVSRGEVYEFGARKDLGISEQGQPGITVNYKYSTGEAKTWLTTQLRELGWKRTWGTEAKIGFVVGAIAIVGSIIAAIVLLTMFIVSPESFKN